MTEPGKRFFPGKQRGRGDAERGGRERMTLTGEQSGKRGDKERRRGGNLRALIGSDGFDVEEDDEDGD